MPTPKVSVVIPTYNRADCISEAIDSAIAQTYKDYEIIVVDDGSQDNTRDVLKQYGDKIKYVYQENKGEAGARNRGIKEAIGEYVAFLDSDDIWLKDKLEKQVKVLSNSNVDTGLVYCAMQVMQNKTLTHKILPSFPAFNFNDLLIGHKCFSMSVLVRKECFERIGLFDESIKLGCDYEMWLRLTLRYKVEFISEPLAIYRKGDGNMSNNLKGMKEGGIKIFRKMRGDTNYPQKLIIIALATEHYLLGRIYYEEKRYKESFREIKNALKIYPLVGSGFISSEETYLNKLLKLTKPYFALLFLSLSIVMKKAR